MKQERPDWARQSVTMQDYYDHYWGLPLHDDQQLFMMLSLELFQAGLSWRTIWERRPAFKEAFADFDIQRVAAFDAADVDRLCQDQAIIRNRRKIVAVIDNAKVIQRMQADGHSFDDYVWRFVDYHPQRLVPQQNTPLPAQTALSRVMAKRFKRDGFKFVGPTIMFSFMTAVGLVNARY